MRFRQSATIEAQGRSGSGRASPAPLRKMSAYLGTHPQAKRTKLADGLSRKQVFGMRRTLMLFAFLLV